MPAGRSAALLGAGLDEIIIKPAERRPAILAAINAARESIRLSMFRCSDFKVLDALSAAVRRGVQVELLLTQRAKGWQRKIREVGDYLDSTGATVHRYALADVKYHAKYLLIDGGLAIISSANLTVECFEQTADFLLRTTDPAIASNLSRLFERDVRAPGNGLPTRWSPRLIAGPESSRQDFLRLIQSARRNIRIVDHKLSDPEILAALQEREQAGAEVRIFSKGAIRRVQYGSKPGLRAHGKMMILDGHRAILGSISLSPAGLGNRRELAIATEDPDCIARLERFLAKAGAGSKLAATNKPSDDRLRKAR